MDLWLPPKPAIIRPAPLDLRRATFPGMFPVGLFNRRPAELSFIGATNDTGNLTTYTFTDAGIGAADPTRRVVVVCHWNSSTDNRTFSSATIGGSSATVHVSVNFFGGVAIISRLLATGTTATVVFTLSGAAQNARIAVYRLINENASSPHDTGGATPGAPFTTLSDTLNVPIDGVAVAGASIGTNQNTHTWTGVTENYDVAVETLARYSGGHATGLAQETGRTIQVQAAGTEDFGALAAMTWG